MHSSSSSGAIAINVWPTLPWRGGRFRGGTLLLGLALLVRCLAGPPRTAAGVLVVTSYRAPAYEEAVEGLRDVLARARIATREVALDRQGAAGELVRELAGKPAMVVAVGSPAVRAVVALDPEPPVLATMVLAAPDAAGRPPAAALTLEVPPEVVLRRLRQLYPSRTRVAVLRGPALSDADAAAVRTHARELGFAVRFIDCPGAKQLLEALASLSGGADWVWCFPDSALYAGPLVSELILASVRRGLPLIGFSEGMVRAGALIGFFPDYCDVGRQTAEAVVRALEGEPPAPRQRPRKFRTAVNERVMRVLGLEPARGSLTGVEIVR